MKKLILSVSIIGLCGASLLQAKWERLGSLKGIKPGTIVINRNDIWSISAEKQADYKGLERDYYLVKWNAQKKDWEKKLLLAKKKEAGLADKPFGISVAPDGAVFILGGYQLTEAFKQAEKAAQEKYEKIAYSRMKEFLENFIAQGKTDKKILDLLNAASTGTYEDKMRFEDAMKDLARVFPQELEPLLRSMHELRRKIYDETTKNIQRRSRHLFRFFNGELKIIYDFGGKNFWPQSVAGLSKNQFVVLKEETKEKVFSDGRKRTFTEGSVDRWDGNAWIRMGGKFMQPRIGKEKFVSVHVNEEGVVFLSSPPYKRKLEKWTGSKWLPIDMKFAEGYGIYNISVVSDKNIWFVISPAANKVAHWNGKGLEIKDVIGHPISVYAGQNVVLVKNTRGEIYRWVEEPKKGGVTPQ